MKGCEIKSAEVSPLPGLDKLRQGYGKATPRLRQGYGKATPRLAKATPRLRQGYAKARLNNSKEMPKVGGAQLPGILIPDGTACERGNALNMILCSAPGKRSTQHISIPRCLQHRQGIPFDQVLRHVRGIATTCRATARLIRDAIDQLEFVGCLIMQRVPIFKNHMVASNSKH